MTSKMLLRGGSKRTLDQMVRQNAHRLGDSLALVDAPDRPLWADGAPRRMTWSQVDTAVSAVASRFFEMGLPSEAIVCVQGMNTSDTLIGILGCMRAGMAAAVMPVTFEAEAVVAIARRLDAKAILSARKLGRDQPLRLLRRLSEMAAADIRFVGAFGTHLPRGIVSFEDCIAFPRRSAVTRLDRVGDAADRVAIVTFDPGSGGVFAVARSHTEWIAAASLFVDGLGLSQNARLLSTMMPLSLAGLASGMVPWLMSGCRLVPHQAFDAVVLGVQLERQDITHVVLPDLALQAVLADRLLDDDAIQGIAGLTREPHRPVILPKTACIPLYFAAMGEIGVVPLGMQVDGSLKLPYAFPSGIGEETCAVEARLDAKGNVGLRGTHIPKAGVDVSMADAPFPVSADGWAMTQYPATSTANGLLVTGERFASSSPAEAPSAQPAPAPAGGAIAAAEPGQDALQEKPLAGAA